MDKNFGKIAMSVWSAFGVKIVNIQENFDKTTVWISVPENSFRVNANGENMSGEILAKRFKTVFKEMDMGKLNVKYKIRKGEFWTKEMSDEATKTYDESINGNGEYAFKI